MVLVLWFLFVQIWMRIFLSRQPEKWIANILHTILFFKNTPKMSLWQNLQLTTSVCGLWTSLILEEKEQLLIQTLSLCVCFLCSLTNLTTFKQQGFPQPLSASTPPKSTLPSVSLPTASLMNPHTTPYFLFFPPQKNFRFVIYYLQEKPLSESVCYRGPLH